MATESPTVSALELLDITALPRPMHISIARSVLAKVDVYAAIMDLTDYVAGCERTATEYARARCADKQARRDECLKIVADHAPVLAELDRVRTRLNIARGRNVCQASRDRLAA
jgi:hypothetical protein